MRRRDATEDSRQLSGTEKKIGLRIAVRIPTQRFAAPSRGWGLLQLWHEGRVDKTPPVDYGWMLSAIAELGLQGVLTPTGDPTIVGL